MLLPLMLSLYLGAVEVSQGIGADRKVTLTARTVADLVSQVTSVNNNDMTNSLNAATTVMAPFPTGNLKVVVSSVTIDAQGKATIAWSDTLNGTGALQGLDRDAAGRACDSQLVADLERGAVHLHAGDRLRRHRLAEPQGSDLHAAADVRLRSRAPRADRSRPIALRRSAAPSST